MAKLSACEWIPTQQIIMNYMLAKGWFLCFLFQIEPQNSTQKAIVINLTPA